MKNLWSDHQGKILIFGLYVLFSAWFLWRLSQFNHTLEGLTYLEIVLKPGTLSFFAGAGGLMIWGASYFFYLIRNRWQWNGDASSIGLFVTIMIVLVLIMIAIIVEIQNPILRAIFMLYIVGAGITATDR